MYKFATFAHVPSLCSITRGCVYIYIYKYHYISSNIINISISLDVNTINWMTNHCPFFGCPNACDLSTLESGTLRRPWVSIWCVHTKLSTLVCMAWNIYIYIDKIYSYTMLYLVMHIKYITTFHIYLILQSCGKVRLKNGRSLASILIGTQWTRISHSKVQQLATTRGSSSRNAAIFILFIGGFLKWGYPLVN